MGTQRQRGFTIIETVLFLGISGTLAVLILVGSGTAISQQRYRDSVNSLKSLLQDQYNLTANTTNDRSAAYGCDNNGVITDNPTGTLYRGTSDCVIVGRSVRFVNEGKDIELAPIVARKVSGTAARPTNDIQALQQYRYSLSPIDQETVQPEWGATTKPAGAPGPRNFTVLIVRSPLSGSIRTFISDDTDSVATIMNRTTLAPNAARTICVMSTGMQGGPTLGVKVDANAGSQAAVELEGQPTGC